MKTTFLLMAQYDGLPVIPVERVCKDFFAPLTLEKFLRKTQSGEIALPIVRMYGSERAAKGVHISDLAAFLDRQAEAARKELAQVRKSA
jgi:hypothetical protein